MAWELIKEEKEVWVNEGDLIIGSEASFGEVLDALVAHANAYMDPVNNNEYDRLKIITELITGR